MQSREEQLVARMGQSQGRSLAPRESTDVKSYSYHDPWGSEGTLENKGKFSSFLMGEEKPPQSWRNCN